MYLSVSVIVQMKCKQRAMLRNSWSILNQFLTAFHNNRIKRERFFCIWRLAEYPHYYCREIKKMFTCSYRSWLKVHHRLDHPTFIIEYYRKNIISISKNIRLTVLFTVIGFSDILQDLTHSFCIVSTLVCLTRECIIHITSDLSSDTSHSYMYTLLNLLLRLFSIVSSLYNLQEPHMASS